MKKILIVFLISLVGCINEPTADNGNNLPVKKDLNLPLVNIGTTANDGTGDPLRTAFGKVNQAVTQINTNTADILLRLPISDTAAMLTPYVNHNDYLFSYLDATSSIQGQLNALSDLIASQRANYYVDQVSGSDAATGLSPTAAWKTIAEVNAHTFIPGDRIYFKRGCEWREQLTISQSGTSDDRIVFSAYGSGAKPIINGADIIAGWHHGHREINNNIWGTASINVTPHRMMVVIAGVLYNQVATLAELTSANLYWVNSTSTPDSVYVYKTADPSLVTAEISKRDYGIYSNQLYITISYLDVRNTGTYGIDFYGGGVTINGYTLVDNVNTYRNRLVGVLFKEGWSNSIIQNSTGTYNGNNFEAWGIEGAEGSRGVACNNIIIKNCYSAYAIHDNIMVGSYTDGSGFQLFNCNNSVIEYCESFGDTYGIALDPWGNPVSMTARYNYVHDTPTGIESSGLGLANAVASGGNIYFYYNLVINCGNVTTGAAFLSYAPVSTGNIYVYNNTFYNSSSHAQLSMFYVVNADNYTIKNNIIWSASSDWKYDVLIDGAAYPTIDYNQYYLTGANPVNPWNHNTTDYTSLANWRTASSQEANSQWGDPLFVNIASDWSLQAGSPAINKGTVIATIPQVDILGNPIVGVPDIGAYEKQ